MKQFCYISHSFCFQIKGDNRIIDYLTPPPWCCLRLCPWLPALGWTEWRRHFPTHLPHQNMLSQYWTAEDTQIKCSGWNCHPYPSENEEGSLHTSSQLFPWRTCFQTGRASWRCHTLPFRFHTGWTPPNLEVGIRVNVKNCYSLNNVSTLDVINDGKATLKTLKAAFAWNHSSF